MSTVHQAQRWQRVLPVLLTGSAAILAFRPVRDYDLWWHLSMGQAVLQNRARSFPDPTGPSPERLYVDPEWVFDLLMFGSHQAGGLVGATLLVSLFAALFALGLWFLARSILGPGRTMESAALASIFMVASSPRFSHRPGLMAMAIGVWMLLLLREGLSRKGKTSLPYLTGGLLLAFLWTQSHSSMVLLPALVLGSLPSPRERAWDREILLVLLVGAGLPLLGPFGLGILGQVGSHASADVARQIMDMEPVPIEAWWPPVMARSQGDYAILLIEASLLAAFVAMARRGILGLRCGSWLLALLAVSLIAVATRFRLEALYLVAPLAIWAWKDLVSFRPLSLSRARTLGGAVLLLSALYALWLRPVLGARVESSYAPIGAVARLMERSVSGKVLCSYHSAAYVAHAMAGRVRIFIDGRTPVFFDVDHLELYARVMEQPVLALQVLGAMESPAALVEKKAPLCGALRGEWSAVWSDDEHVLFLREQDPRDFQLLDPCEGLIGNLELCRAGPLELRARMLQEIEARWTQRPDDGYEARLGALLSLECGAPSPLQAARWFERARESEPRHPYLGTLAGLLAMRQGDIGGALAGLGRARPDDPLASSALSEIHLLSGRPERALDHLDRHLAAVDQKKPALPLILEQRGRALEAMGRLDEAQSAYLRAALLGRGSARARLERARQEGALEERLEVILELLAESPAEAPQEER